MNEQTHKTDGTPDSQKEEGRRMTTKSATARSSITDTHAEHKKVIDAEEQQDSDRLSVDCRVSADESILNLISATGAQSQIGMLMETTAKAARSIILRAADHVGCAESAFDTACMEIHLRFTEPEMLFQICSREEEDGKN